MAVTPAKSLLKHKSVVPGSPIASKQRFITPTLSAIVWPSALALVHINTKSPSSALATLAPTGPKSLPGSAWNDRNSNWVGS